MEGRGNRQMPDSIDNKFPSEAFPKTLQGENTEALTVWQGGRASAVVLRCLTSRELRCGTGDKVSAQNQHSPGTEPPRAVPFFCTRSCLPCLCVRCC